MRSVSVVLALGVLAAVLAPTPACAATAIASFSVSATVVSSCQATPNVSSANGTLAVTMEHAASATAVTCTLPTPYTVSARTITVSASVAENHKAALAGNGFLPSHSSGAQNANQQTLPPAPQTEAIVVTVSY